MVQLSIDTSNVNCAVHLMAHDGLSCEICDEIGRGHAERLIGMIDHVLNERDLSPNDITKIAVTIGPGSFTGVRVGLAAARGYAAALNIPVVGISSLKALSKKNNLGGSTLVILDAKRDQYYTELFDDHGTSIEGPALYTKGDEVPEAWRHQASLVLVGTGAEAIAPHLPNASIISTDAAPAIADVAQLGQSLEPDVTPPKPLYLRAADAKPQNPDKIIARVSS
ncbi:MAG: tRNA (adenosine(37)-N6)-threonylcarbamoyltransferase complex dimerization subunit type 1 TsaB [Hyphomicrobiales bacterium]